VNLVACSIHFRLRLSERVRGNPMSRSKRPLMAVFIMPSNFALSFSCQERAGERLRGEDGKIRVGEVRLDGGAKRPGGSPVIRY